MEVNTLDEMITNLGILVSVTEPKNYPLDRYVDVSPDNLIPAIQKLKEYGVTHLSTIPAYDCDEGYRLLYIMSIPIKDKKWGKLTFVVTIDKDKPEIESLTSEIPGAVYYEREVFDMLGIKFHNHPDHRRLLSPDIMPDDVFPLRKDITFQEIRDRLAAEAKVRYEE
ncbi:MAG: NADH-quinone oxidoreductase subunit C [Candidatus Hodarchaeales archaeon]